MSSRHALYAAVVSAGALARKAGSVSAEINQPGSPAASKTSSSGNVVVKEEESHLPHADVDLARAIAVMERYHRMSQDALSANASASTQESLQRVRDPSLHSSSEGGREADEKALPNLSSPAPVGQDPRPEPSTDAADAPSPQLSPKVPAPAVPSEQGTGAPPESVPVTAKSNAGKPKGKKKKAPRISAERLFADFHADGNVCVPHVIVGGGTAAWSAVQAIQRRDPSASILVVTEEAHYPYNRTPLSKELWAPDAAGLFTSEFGTKGAVEYTYADVAGLAAETAAADGDIPLKLSSSVSILRGTAVESLDTDARTITLSSGHAVQYGKLLLATGGLPRSAGSVCDALETNESVRESVSVFRTLDDFRRLRSELGPPGSSVAVVGAGFLGTELAVAMASEGRNVTLLCAEPGVLYKVLPRYLSQNLASKLVSAGVNVVESAIVVDAQTVSKEDNRVVLSVESGEEPCLAPVDKVVVCTGIVPRTELASGAGLEVDSRNGGIVVNDQMSAEADVYVAGDVASFWDRALGRRRVEHWDHAVVSGRIAGDRMAGGDSRYGLQSMFWSDLDNVGVSFSAVGLVDHELSTMAVWNLEEEAFEHAPSANKYKEGVVWYLKDNVVVGAILWNVHDRKALAAARKAIATKRKLIDDISAQEIVLLPHAEHSCVIRTEALTVDIL